MASPVDITKPTKECNYCISFFKILKNIVNIPVSVSHYAVMITLLISNALKIFQVVKFVKIMDTANKFLNGI